MPEPDCQNETRQQWMDRCMADSESREDFPDEDQRAAFCSSRWENRCGVSGDDGENGARVIYDAIRRPRDCLSHHLGLWVAEWGWLQQAKQAVESGTWRPRAEEEEKSAAVLYSVNKSGVAFIPIEGATMKGDSKFGGTSTLRLRRALRSAAHDPGVEGVMLMIDSPGGTVAGIEEAANEIERTAEVKPVFAHAEDMVASAAVWLASKATRLTATASTRAGSIGVAGLIEETSEKAKMEGRQIHKITNTGGETFKAMFAEGTEVTDEQLAEAKRMVNQTFERFVTAIAESPREIDREGVMSIADGRVFSAEEATDAGLLDAVESADDAVEALMSVIEDRRRRKRSESRQRRQRMRAIEIDGGVASINEMRRMELDR